jgi:acyl carrier protein
LHPSEFSTLKNTMGAKTRQHAEETWNLEELLSRELGIPREQITRASRFDGDLGIDWFDRLELLDSVEITFDIRISDDAAQQLETVADLETLVLRSEADRRNPVRGSPPNGDRDHDRLRRLRRRATGAATLDKARPTGGRFALTELGRAPGGARISTGGRRRDR